MQFSIHHTAARLFVHFSQYLSRQELKVLKALADGVHGSQSIVSDADVTGGDGERKANVIQRQSKLASERKANVI